MLAAVVAFSSCAIVALGSSWQASKEEPLANDEVEVVVNPHGSFTQKAQESVESTNQAEHHDNVAKHEQASGGESSEGAEELHKQHQKAAHEIQKADDKKLAVSETCSSFTDVKACRAADIICRWSFLSSTCQACEEITKQSECDRRCTWKITGKSKKDFKGKCANWEAFESDDCKRRFGCTPKKGLGNSNAIVKAKSCSTGFSGCGPKDWCEFTFTRCQPHDLCQITRATCKTRPAFMVDSELVVYVDEKVKTVVELLISISSCHLCFIKALELMFAYSKLNLALTSGSMRHKSTGKTFHKLAADLQSTPMGHLDFLKGVSGLDEFKDMKFQELVKHSIDIFFEKFSFLKKVLSVFGLEEAMEGLKNKPFDHTLNSVMDDAFYDELDEKKTEDEAKASAAALMQFDQDVDLDHVDSLMQVGDGVDWGSIVKKVGCVVIVAISQALDIQSKVDAAADDLGEVGSTLMSLAKNATVLGCPLEKLLEKKEEEKKAEEADAA